MNNEFMSGLLTGITSAIIFNPIDKAIYLSTIQNLKITNPYIWKNCFKGSFITISSRMITSGLYFGYLDYFTNNCSNNLQSALLTSVSCSITNPLQLVKYHSWFNNLSIHNSFNFIKNNYGYKGFLIGINPLICRDFIFNYLYISNKKKDDDLYNLMVISFSLIVVAPLNFIKNKKYGSNEPLKLIFNNFKLKQLGITQGLFRTTISFYFNQSLYNFLSSTISL